jgi:NADH-quinone oxidoreductase subunit C
MTNSLPVERLKEIISFILGGEVPVDTNSTPLSISIYSDKILAVCDVLYKHPEFFFDNLSCLTGIDNGKDVGTMEVIYNLYSIPFNHHVMLKVVLPREKPEIDSVISIWRTANWQEREAFDMYGIVFNNHPDLRRILMPADWEGYPLRKDYAQQEEYRGITVKSST